jgi:hypothetical protein
MIHHVAVGVALVRPPRIDQFRAYVIEADTEQAAELTAHAMACRGAAMPVWIGWPEDVPHLPEEWLR